MVQLANPKTATHSQIELLEYALRQLTGISRSSWPHIPMDLHSAFGQYMGRDVWTGEYDPLTLSEAALLIVRDAILHTGAFADDEVQD